MSSEPAATVGADEAQAPSSPGLDEWPRPPRPSWAGRAVAAAVVLAALFVYTRYGTQARLLHDDAIFVYGGQQMADGVPPYVSIFDHKGPLSTMLCGVGAWVARLAGLDELTTIRRLFLLSALGAVLGIFGAGRRLFGSTRAGLLAAAVFLAYSRFGFHALGGPRPKTLVVGCEALALWAMASRSWFWAGACGALAGLTWQPTAIFAFAAIGLAGADPSGKGRLANALRATAGMVVPLAIVGGYFLAMGAFGAFFEGAVAFNLRYLASPTSVRLHLFKLAEAIYESNIGLGFTVALGLLAMPLAFLWRARRVGVGKALLRDPFACLFVTLPWPLAWSLADFQGYPDFFVFLPYAALGFAWILDRAWNGIRLDLRAPEDTRRPDGAWLWVLSALLAIGGATWVANYYRTAELPAQRAEVAELLASFPNENVVFLGAPDAMVLGERTNPTRYGFLMRGIDALIDDTHADGFPGWLDGLGEPDGVIVGRIVLRSIAPDHLATLEAWLERFVLDEDASDSWLVYRASTEVR